MPKIAIVGAKNSGKTTVIEQLIVRFRKRGMRIATIKHTAHSHTFDTPGKDSHRHRVAGAAQTLAISSSEMALFSDCEPELEADIERLIEERSDLCLVEGDKLSDVPKILLTRSVEDISTEELTNVIATYGPIAIDADVPHIELDDIDSLCEFIVDAVSTQAQVRSVDE